MFTALWAQVPLAAVAFVLIGKKMFIFKQKKHTHTRVLDIKGPVGADPAVRHSGTNSCVAAEAHRRMKTPEPLRTFMEFSEEAAKRCLI